MPPRTLARAFTNVSRWLWTMLQPSKKQVILFMAANPDCSSHLKLAEECAGIQRELKMTLRRDEYQLESRWAVSVDELMRHVTELDPTVIHLSGHGGHDGEVILQDDHGQAQAVSAAALAMMVAAAGRRVRVIVLNACYGTRQAHALLSAIDCVVCMQGAIGDDAARVFAVRFYGALGNGRSVGNAFAHGIAALAAKQLPDAALPRCLTRLGVEAHEIVLTCGAGTHLS